MKELISLTFEYWYILIGMVFFYFGRVSTNKQTGDENITSGQGVTSLDADTQVSNYIGHEINITGKDLGLSFKSN